MKNVTASTRIAISRQRYDCWKVAEPTDTPGTIQELSVLLEILGDEESGYHLNATLEGCFTSDSWHETQEEAFATAERVFNVPRSAWRAKKVKRI